MHVLLLFVLIMQIVVIILITILFIWLVGRKYYLVRLKVWGAGFRTHQESGLEYPDLVHVQWAFVARCRSLLYLRNQ